MKRIFSHPLVALAAGAALRFFFVLKYPAGSGDTVLYEQLAANWLQHHIYALNIDGVLTPVDTRMPGYPAFLATINYCPQRQNRQRRSPLGHVRSGFS